MKPVRDYSFQGLILGQPPSQTMSFSDGEKSIVNKIRIRHELMQEGFHLFVEGVIKSAV